MGCCLGKPDTEKQTLTKGKQPPASYNTQTNDFSNIMEKLTKYEKILQEKDATIKTLSERLSREMSAKVASDESSVENISIKARPMNVAEEYVLACSNEWLAAKSMLDEYIEGRSKQAFECVILELLCTIIKIAEVKARNHFVVKEEKLKKFLTQYIETTDETNFTVVKIPTDVRNVLTDYLRNTSDDINLQQIEEAIKSELDEVSKEEIHDVYLDLWKQTRQETSLLDYISKIARIAWKMSIQRPPMTFHFSHKWLGDKYQELHWNSDPDVANPKMVHVYPRLYHSESLMTKGKVLIGDRTNMEQR